MFSRERKGERGRQQCIEKLLLVTASTEFLTKFGSLITGRNAEYFLHSQNYLKSSIMILGEFSSLLRASMTMKEVHPIEKYFPHPACTSLATSKFTCRVQALNTIKKVSLLLSCNLQDCSWLYLPTCYLALLLVSPIWHWTHRWWIRKVTTCLLPYIHIHNSRFPHTYLIWELHLGPAGQSFTKTDGQSEPEDRSGEESDPVWRHAHFLSGHFGSSETYPEIENIGFIPARQNISLNSES